MGEHGRDVEEDETNPSDVKGVAGVWVWTLRRQVKRLVIIALCTYVGVCVFINLFQRRLVYFPDTGAYSVTPADVGLEYEDLTLQTEDGVSIAAWYVAHHEPKGSAIFCHGNAGNISGRLNTIKLLHQMGLNVLVFDYRGFGQSAGKPSELGTYEDAETVWRYLVETRGESPGRVILIGRSLGGAVAIELATQHAPAGLVVESTFTSLLDIGRLFYPLLPVKLLLSYRYDSIAKVPDIGCPKLFFHGRDDGLIPLPNGRELFEAAADPKQFIETPGGHGEAGFSYSTETIDQLAAFVDQVLSTR